jgi:hypothetical protein
MYLVCCVEKNVGLVEEVGEEVLDRTDLDELVVCEFAEESIREEGYYGVYWGHINNAQTG